MSDPLERDGDPLFAAAAEYGRTHLGWRDEVPFGSGRPASSDPIELTARDAMDSLNTAYENANDPHEVACGNAAAITTAVLVLAEQQRVANMIAFGQATGESYRTEIRKALGISHE